MGDELKRDLSNCFARAGLDCEMDETAAQLRDTILGVIVARESLAFEHGQSLLAAERGRREEAEAFVEWCANAPINMQSTPSAIEIVRVRARAFLAAAFPQKGAE